VFATIAAVTIVCAPRDARKPATTTQNHLVAEHVTVVRTRHFRQNAIDQATVTGKRSSTRWIRDFSNPRLSWQREHFQSG
jgi:hypothetical protein